MRQALSYKALILYGIVLVVVLIDRETVEGFQSSFRANRLRFTSVDPSGTNFGNHWGIGHSSWPLLRLSSSEQADVVAAKDFDALQMIFSKYCDEEGLMAKEKAISVPVIAELLVSEAACSSIRDPCQ